MLYIFVNSWSIKPLRLMMRKRDNSDFIGNMCRNSEKLEFHTVKLERKEELKSVAYFVDSPCEWKPEFILRSFQYVPCLLEP